ncbi:hypothetical protein [Jiangella alkaliphila]|uniref:Uncharacterized protein n=1 Tax=Jiangella alkaliphila TaxID=419479 RepID=A0A1H2JXU2_9ACTN|nr:hypothetical protein [Jiangella alkaliphila]SDU61294.1 hypothetical protein SAMN04488563_3205 [Jiangella alkaliphila]
MSEIRDTAATASTTDEVQPNGLIVLGSASGTADGDAGECADGFCAL